MKPPFGTLNGKLAKMIISSAPKYTSITEPFGDGGSLALEMAKRKPKTHNLNIEDEILFGAFVTVQKLSAGDRRRLKGFDWVGSSEAFDAASAITATEGPDFLYRFFYLKKFGMKMGKDPEAMPEFDVLSMGEDISSVLMGVPLMKSALKNVTITNDDPMIHVTGGGAFLVLLPKKQEHVEAVQSRIGSLGGNFFFAAAVADGRAVIDAAKKYKNLNVLGAKISKIMMSTFEIITNYDSKLEPLDTAAMGAMG